MVRALNILIKGIHDQESLEMGAFTNPQVTVNIMAFNNWYSNYAHLSFLLNDGLLEDKPLALLFLIII